MRRQNVRPSNEYFYEFYNTALKQEGRGDWQWQVANF